MASNNRQGTQSTKSKAVQIGDRISDWTSKLFAHPYTQVGVIVLCCLWFALGLNVNVLTAGLSILAITLTQMVLNSQYDREADAHRRDIAMHAKLDELIAASKQARNELVGIEEKEEEEIVQLKEEVKEAIEETAVDAATEAKAKQAVERAAQELTKGARAKNGNGSSARKKRAGGAKS